MERMNGTQAVFTAIFALMLLAAVFGYGTDDVNGTEARQGTTIVNNYHNNTTVEYNNTTILSEPEWFSEGGIADIHWNSDSMASQTDGLPDTSLWNYTECAALDGGTPEVYIQTFFASPLYYPRCDIYLTSISTQSGQMLIIYEWTGFVLNTTCDGFTVHSTSTSTSSGNVYSSINGAGEWRAPGHAMDCVHDLYIDDISPYTTGSTTIREPVLWSVAYSFRDVTVV